MEGEWGVVCFSGGSDCHSAAVQGRNLSWCRVCFFPLHGIAEVMRAYPKLLSHRQVCVALKERALNNPWICPSTHMAGVVGWRPVQELVQPEQVLRLGTGIALEAASAQVLLGSRTRRDWIHMYTRVHPGGGHSLPLVLLQTRSVVGDACESPLGWLGSTGCSHWTSYNHSRTCRSSLGMVSSEHAW